MSFHIIQKLIMLESPEISGFKLSDFEEKIFFTINNFRENPKNYINKKELVSKKSSLNMKLFSNL